MRKVIKSLISMIILIFVAIFIFNFITDIKGITVKYFSDGQIIKMTKEIDIDKNDYNISYDKNGNKYFVTVTPNVDIEYLTVNMVYRSDDQLFTTVRDFKTINNLIHGAKYLYSFDSSDVISDTTQLYNYYGEGKKIVKAHLFD